MCPFTHLVLYLSKQHLWVKFIHLAMYMQCSMSEYKITVSHWPFFNQFHYFCTFAMGWLNARQHFLQMVNEIWILIFKPGMRRSKAGTCLVSSNHFCVGHVCVCLCVCPRGHKKLLNMKWSFNNQLNKFCCFSVALYCICYEYYVWAWP